MSKQARKKKDGHRKGKKLEAMRAEEWRRHLESGRGYSAPRDAPHLGHTTHQQGLPISKSRHITGPRWDHQAGLGRHWLARSARGLRPRGG